MKRSVIVVLLLFLSIGNFAQSSWRGEASVWTDGLPASGFFAATDEFPPQTVLLVKNLRTGKSLQVRVLSRGPEENNGEFIFLNAMAGSYLGIQQDDNDPVVVTWESDIAKSEENFLEENPGDTVVVDDDPTPPVNNQTIPISLEENPETVLLTDPVDDPQQSNEQDPRVSPETLEGDTQDPSDPNLPNAVERPIDEPVDPIDEPVDPVEDPETPRISPESVSEGSLAALDTELPNFPTRPDVTDPIDPIDPIDEPVDPVDDPDTPRVSPRMATSETQLLPNLVLPGEPSARITEVPVDEPGDQRPRTSPRPSLGDSTPEVLTDLLIPNIDDLGEMAPDLDPELLPPLSEGLPGSIPVLPLADGNPDRDLEAWLADSSALDRGQGTEPAIVEPEKEIPRFRNNPAISADDLGDPILPTLGETPRTRFTPALTEDELPELVLPTGQDPADRPNTRYTPDMPESDLPDLVIPDPLEKPEVPDTRFTPDIQDPANPDLVIPGTEDLERPSTLVYAGNEVTGLEEDPLPDLVLPEVGERPVSSGENPVDVAVNPSDNIRVPDLPEGRETDPDVIDPVITDPVETDPVVTDPVVTDPDLVIGDPSDNNGYTSEPGALRGELLGRVKIITSRDSSKDYIQLGVYSQEESLLAALSRLESYVPLSVLITSNGSYKLLAGPLPRDQVGVLMYHYRSQGFKDAFVLRGR